MGDIKLDGATRNLESDNVRALAEAFPEVVADGKVDFDKLKLILGEDIDDTDERYSFTWPGKRDAIKMAISRSTGTLRPDKKSSKDWDTTENLFIEGDNLEVLRVLQNSYRGKVKMIYIDPPYNTGKDFVYKDDFKDNIKNYKEQADLGGQSNPETAGRYHTNWLNMMYPRLRLAKNLLTDDGLIFISIGDVEAHNLRKICDEVLGESNFLTEFIWEKTQHFGRQKINSYSNADRVLCYARSAYNNGILKELLVEHVKTEFEDAPLHNASNPENEILFPAGSVKFNIPDGSYSETTNPEKYQLLNEVNVSGGYNQNDFKLKFRSRWNAAKVIAELDNGVTYWIKSSNFAVRAIYGDDKTSNDSPRQIIFTNSNSNKAFTKAREFYKVGSNEEGSSMVSELFDGQDLFSYPKPVSLITYFIFLLFDKSNESYVKDGYYLDFFAGSGTTAQAVMTANALDGGTRKFILCQLPEVIDPNLASDQNEKARLERASNFLDKLGKRKVLSELSLERIRRAGDKVKTDHKDSLAERTSTLDIGFKAFTLDTTNFREWDSNTDNIQNELLAALETFKEGRTSEDALYEVLLKYGVDITEPVEVLTLAGKQVYSLAGNYLLVCLEKEIPFATIEAMAALKPERVVCYDDGFADEDIKQNSLETLKRAGVADVRVV